MQYNNPQPPAAEVKEPATAYATAIPAIPVWPNVNVNVNVNVNDNDDYDYDDNIGAPESVTVNTYAELCQKLEEGMADIEAGREYTWEEVRRELRREFFNESI